MAEQTSIDGLVAEGTLSSGTIRAAALEQRTAALQAENASLREQLGELMRRVRQLEQAASRRVP